MSVALTDLLIELSEPENLLLFTQDPEAVMSRFPLSEEDKEALHSSNNARLRSRVRSVEKDERANQYTQFSGPHQPRGEIEVDLEIYNDSHDMVALGGKEMLFVDQAGQFFKGVANSK
jgi:hypothetical protein